jgi:hypothetical protein
MPLTKSCIIPPPNKPTEPLHFDARLPRENRKASAHPPTRPAFAVGGWFDKLIILPVASIVSYRLRRQHNLIHHSDDRKLIANKRANKPAVMKARILAVLFSCLLWAPIPAAETAPHKNLVDDPALLNAMEIFMGMSAQERYETMHGLMEAVGHDPSKRAEMETLIKMLPQMDYDDDNDASVTSLRQMIHDDEMRKAQHEAQRQVEGQDWESFWAMQADILEATIASGQLTPEQAADFKTDEDAWKAQLRIIFDDLQQRGGGHAEL